MSGSTPRPTITPDARDATMTEPEQHEEIGRRTLQITDLKEELWDVEDRVDGTEQRRDTLMKGLTSKAHEIGIHKSKARELEDKLHLLEGTCEEIAHSMRRADGAAAADLQKMQQRLQAIEEETSAAFANAGAEKQRAAVLHAEGSSLRAKTEAAKRELAREHEQLAQEEAAQEAMQARAEKRFEQEEAERRDDSTKQLLSAEQAASSARSQVLRLEQELAGEKATRMGLEASLDASRERHTSLEDECKALEEHLQHLGLQEETRNLEDELEKTRQHCHNLSVQSAKIQNQKELNRQGLQGALDETRRMLADHLASTSHTDAADAELQVLQQALKEAKSQAAEQVAAVARLELECGSLQAEVDKVENDFQAASRLGTGDQQRQPTELTLELRAAEQSLRAAARRGDDKAAEAALVEAQVVESEKMAQQKEALLRRKLQELYSWLRQVNSVN